MDAVLGVERCGLIYMKSKPYAHCGFPEAAFERYAEVMVNLGYQVARIEQTETPADMEVRCKSLARATKFDKVVRREICQMQSKATMTNGLSESAYLTSFTATKSLEDDSRVLVGLCFLDTTVGNVQLFVNLIFILYARWRFKIVCLQTKIASLAIHEKTL